VLFVDLLVHPARTVEFGQDVLAAGVGFSFGHDARSWQFHGYVGAEPTLRVREESSAPAESPILPQWGATAIIPPDRDQSWENGQNVPLRAVPEPTAIRSNPPSVSTQVATPVQRLSRWRETVSIVAKFARSGLRARRRRRQEGVGHDCFSESKVLSVMVVGPDTVLDAPGSILMN